MNLTFSGFCVWVKVYREYKLRERKSRSTTSWFRNEEMLELIWAYRLIHHEWQTTGINRFPCRVCAPTRSSKSDSYVVKDTHGAIFCWWIAFNRDGYVTTFQMEFSINWNAFFWRCLQNQLLCTVIHSFKSLPVFFLFQIFNIFIVFDKIFNLYINTTWL